MYNHCTLQLKTPNSNPPWHSVLDVTLYLPMTCGRTVVFIHQ